MKLTLSIAASAGALSTLLEFIDSNPADFEISTSPSVETPKTAPVTQTNVPSVETPITAPVVQTPVVEQPTAPVVQTPVVEQPTAPTPTVVDVNATLDADGVPWDERIHASSKSTIADGTWRKRRGVDDALYESVKLELKSAAAPTMPSGDVEQPTAPVAQTPTMPSGDVEQPTAPVAQTPVVEQPTAPVATPPVTQPTAPVATPPVTQPTAPVAQFVAGAIDFNGFMQNIGKIMQMNPTVNVEYLTKLKDETATAFGSSLNAITDIAPNQQMVDYVIQLMQRDQTWT